MTSEATTVWLLSELYYPELTSTGHYMTELAERLAADGRRVAVLCGQPTYGAHGTRAPRREARNGVEIRRCRGTTFHKDNLLGRVANIVTLSAAAMWAGLRHIERGDVVVAVTNPPTMPLVGLVSSALRRARFVPVFHDILPVVLEVAGGRSPNGPAVRIAGAMTSLVVGRATTVVAVGRPLVAELQADDRTEVVVIPNWADDETVAPVDARASVLRAELGLTERKVALYAGTFGRANDLASLIDAAAALRHRDDISIVLCGTGPLRKSIERAITDLENVVVTGPYPRDRQSDMYGIGDLTVIPMLGGMGRSSMPSRAYNSLAAGRPIVAATEADSELALLITEHDVGRVVPPGNASALAAAIESVLDDPSLAAVARRARIAAEGPCSAQQALSAWSALVGRLLDDDA